MPSFDVVSEVDMHEVDNAVNQAKKEIETRYDFKGSKTEITKEENLITVVSEDSMKLKAVNQILNEKMAKRGVGLRSLKYQEPEKAGGDMLRQRIEILQGISTDDARKIVKYSKDQKLKKVQAQIQQDQVRVTAPKRDDLQKVIALLKQEIDTIELQFTNFRD